MLAISIVSSVVAVFSLLVAWRSYEVGKRSVIEARRSADAAEVSAEAAKRSAQTDAAADLRARTPVISVSRLSKAGYRSGETAAVYEVVHGGAEPLASVKLLRPQTDNSVHYTVAATGRSDFGEEADLGPMPVGGRARFSLSVGPWVDGEKLPDLGVQLICSTASGDGWTLHFDLERPRTRPARIVLPKGSRS